MTIREMVTAIQVEIRDEDVTPHRAVELLNRLTAIIGNCLVEIRDAEMAYNERLLELLDEDGTKARATVKASTTPEYRRLREGRDTKEHVEAMVGALKYQIRASEAEMRMTR